VHKILHIVPLSFYNLNYTSVKSFSSTIPHVDIVTVNV